MTSKEALQDLFTISNKITKDKLNLDTTEIFERYKVIREDLGVLDTLKKLFIDYFPAVQLKKYTDGSHAIETTQDYNSMVQIDEEEYKKIKEWLEEKQ